MLRFKAIWTSALCLALLAGLTTACAKREPKTTPAPTGTAATKEPAPEATGWQPEKAQPESLEVTSADAFNKQGVLKRIHFETDKWEITPEGRRILKENAAWILAHPEFRLSVEGHCDERNTEAYNLALGERRANAAKEYLMGLGVPGEKIQTVSYGKARPLDPEHSEEAWDQNRRDEFVLIDIQK